MLFRSGLVRVMVRVASIPLPPGMCRSMTTTSGCNSAASLTASGPLAAWASTRYPEPVIWVGALIAAVFAAAWLLLLRIDPYQPAPVREAGSLRA